MGIRITYRRTGGVCAVLMFGAVAVAATTLAAAVAAAMLIAAVAVLASARLAATLWPRSWRRRPGPLPVPWPYETIDATVVHFHPSL